MLVSLRQRLVALPRGNKTQEQVGVLLGGSQNKG